MKKLMLYAAAAALMLLPLCSYAFYDVDFSTDEGKAISEMEIRGYIKGFEDNSFRPRATLTRAEFVTIINKMYGYKVEGENVFSDIAADDWYFSDVLRAVQAGYIKGMGDGTFCPNETVTREQVCVMLNAILNMEQLPYSRTISDYVSDWARDSVEKLVSNRLFRLEDGGRFRAIEAITRGEACVALEKCIVDSPAEIEPIDLENMAREELEKKLSSMIECMDNEIIPLAEEGTAKTVAQRVSASMKAYLADPEYDYMTESKKVYELYKTLGEEKADELKALVFDKADPDELTVLYYFFYE